MNPELNELFAVIFFVGVIMTIWYFFKPDDKD